MPGLHLTRTSPRPKCGGLFCGAVRYTSYPLRLDGQPRKILQWSCAAYGVRTQMGLRDTTLTYIVGHFWPTFLVNLESSHCPQSTLDPRFRQSDLQGSLGDINSQCLGNVTKISVRSHTTHTGKLSRPKREIFLLKPTTRKSEVIACSSPGESDLQYLNVSIIRL